MKNIGQKTAVSPAVPVRDPQRVLSYFLAEKTPLLIVTISGLIYNFGLLAGPWYQGRLAQCLLDIYNGIRTFSDMLILALTYAATIGIVQFSRYIKRLYVRVFANDVSRSMKQTLYANLISRSHTELESENAGALIVKAVSDADACAEGMRKFTTEIFDTGVALAAYICMLLYYDLRLGIICLIFPPISYVIAEKMKVIVERTGAAAKESAGRLSAATLDRISGAVTYRVFGCEPQRDSDYEKHLQDYERTSVLSNIWVSSLTPLYKVISLVSVLFILYFGSRNVLHTGWADWDIAAFTTFLVCYTKLSNKSSKAAKLFNAVQKAKVSWKRIKPMLHCTDTAAEAEHPTGSDPKASGALSVRDLSFAYPGKPQLFGGLSFDAFPGQIIGVTGPVACGKSALGKVFLCELPYTGSVTLGGEELSSLSGTELNSLIGYLGHDPELMSDTIRNNILMGADADSRPLIRSVRFDEELKEMPERENTRIGSGGIRLSGGQQQRLALARTLSRKKPLYILDDPFSALDRRTEREIYDNLRILAENAIVILISHRLYLFPDTDAVLFMKDASVTVSTHSELMQTCEEYRKLYETQTEEGDSDEKA